MTAQGKDMEKKANNRELASLIKVAKVLRGLRAKE
jgi:hypothetical protein